MNCVVAGVTYGFLVAILFYGWAAFWTAMIAGKLPDRPKDYILVVIGSILLGLIWPISLPMHLAFDIKESA